MFMFSLYYGYVVRVRATYSISNVAQTLLAPVPEVQQSQSLSAYRAGAGAAQAGLMYQQRSQNPGMWMKCNKIAW